MEQPLPENIRIIGLDYQPKNGTVRFYLHSDDTWKIAEAAVPVWVGTLDRADLRTTAAESQNASGPAGQVETG